MSATEIEIEPNAVILYHLTQIPVCRTNNATIGFGELRRADFAELHLLNVSK